MRTYQLYITDTPEEKESIIKLAETSSVPIMMYDSSKFYIFHNGRMESFVFEHATVNNTNADFEQFKARFEEYCVKVDIHEEQLESLVGIFNPVVFRKEPDITSNEHPAT